MGVQAGSCRMRRAVEPLAPALLQFAFFVGHIQRMDALFEASFSPLASSGKVLSKCGK